MSEQTGFNGKIMAAGVDLSKVTEQHQKAKLQRAAGRAQSAFVLLQKMFEHEAGRASGGQGGKIDLPRCRELVHLAFDTFDYFEAQATKGLNDSA